jgi:hypothetical protein
MGAACIAITRIIESVVVFRIAILPGFRIRSVDPGLVGVKWPSAIAGAHKVGHSHRRGRPALLGDGFWALESNLHWDDAGNADVAEGADNVCYR